MSQFIVSYFKTPQKKALMKFHSNLHKNQWAVYPLPFAYFYFETCHPDSHAPLLKNKICGTYLSFNFLRWTWNIGIYKPLQ